jgi:hypothetical protein
VVSQAYRYVHTYSSNKKEKKKRKKKKENKKNETQKKTPPLLLLMLVHFSSIAGTKGYLDSTRALSPTSCASSQVP